MDVVYLVKYEKQNDELRYSLRSLTNLDHDRVWMSGFTPPWVTKAGSIPVRQMSNKNKATTANLIAACKRREVSDPFILFNDDFFVLHYLAEVPALHRGRISDWIAECGSGAGYMRGAIDTLRKLRELGVEDPMSYDLHVPLVVHKQTMIEAIEHCDGIRTAHKRSMYGNLAGLGGELVSDCKIRGQKEVPEEDWLFVSTEDGGFACDEIGRYLRKKFPEPSQYERTI